MAYGKKNMNPQILKLREDVGSVDKNLIRILEKRFEITNKIGEIKNVNGIPIEDLKREEEIINFQQKLTKISPEFVKKLFKLIFEESKKSQLK